MRRSNKAIVTLAIGDKYLNDWKGTCEKNWRQYADIHQFDLVCIDQPLDESDRAKKRSPAWQKCLILGHESVRDYDTVVWIDSDILINNAIAPCITDSVPVGKVGAIQMYDQPTPELYQTVLDRMYDWWGSAAVQNRTAEEYHTAYGLPAGIAQVVQTGVMVLSPTCHRQLLEKVYYDYEEKGGRQWNMEMRPLSYELLKAKCVHWIDGRFNVNWVEYMFLHYPFLLTSIPRNHALPRIRAKLKILIEGSIRRDLRRACVANAFLSSYFLHFGGDYISDMKLLDLTARSLRACCF